MRLVRSSRAHRTRSLTIEPDYLYLYTADPGVPSEPNTCTITPLNIVYPIIVNELAGLEYSLDDVTYSASLTLANDYAGDIYLRLDGSVEVDGDLEISSAGLASSYVRVQGQIGGSLAAFTLTINATIDGSPIAAHIYKYDDELETYADTGETTPYVFNPRDWWDGDLSGSYRVALSGCITTDPQIVLDPLEKSEVLNYAVTELQYGIYGGREINDMIVYDSYIPVSTAGELNQIRHNDYVAPEVATFGAGSEWEGEYEYGLNKKYVQLAAISLDMYIYDMGWIPIGNEINSFNGIYDGSGLTISSLFICRSEEYQGLFGVANGANMSNIGLLDVDITCGDQSGSLVGLAISTIITNCYATGTVTTWNPIIYTGEQISDLVNNQGYTPIYTIDDMESVALNLSGKYVLVNDIEYDYPGVPDEGWLPIGSNEAPFTGIFEGAGNTIGGITTFRYGDYQGLFASLDRAEIYNLGVINSNIKGENNMGIISGRMSMALIMGCSTSGTVLPYDGGIPNLIFSPTPEEFDIMIDDTIEITCLIADTTIYYTLDGTDPGPENELSVIYENPIQVTETVTIKARAYKEGWVESNIASGYYESVIPLIMNLTGADGTGYIRLGVTQNTTISVASGDCYVGEASNPDTQSVNILSSYTYKKLYVKGTGTLKINNRELVRYIWLHGSSISGFTVNLTGTMLTYIYAFGVGAMLNGTDITGMPLENITLYSLTAGSVTGSITDMALTYLRCQSAAGITGEIGDQCKLTKILLTNAHFDYMATDISAFAASLNSALSIAGNGAFTTTEYQYILRHLSWSSWSETKTITITDASCGLADTNQGGRWGTFVETPSASEPSVMAIALGDLAIKGVTMTISGLDCATWTTGFPQYFSDWIAYYIALGA